MIGFRTTVLCLVLLAAVGGGALVWNAWNAGVDIKEKIVAIGAKGDLCSTLSDEERLDLIGVDTPIQLLEVEGALDRYTCRWAVEDFKNVSAFVQVVSAPADDWAREVAPALKSAEDVNPGAARLSELARQPVTSQEDGCRLASALFEVGGEPPGAQRMVSQGVSSQSNPIMTAHSCVDGTYSAVMVTAPALRLDLRLARRTAKALRTVESRLS